jgi:macrolide transport system ATP-binding/permease protein
MQTLLNDLRYALRQLRKSPGFAATAILTLALGIGANAAIFTLVHAVLLRNLPVADPKTLVRVGDTDECCIEGGAPGSNDYSIFAYELYQQLRDGTPEFEQLAAMQAGNERMTVRGSKTDALAKSTRSEFVSGNYFLTLGLKPYAGRLMLPADDQPNAAPVAVLSYGTWQRDFGLDPSIVGSTLIVDTHPVTVVGVTPPSFYGDRLGTSPAGVFLPFSQEPIMDVAPLLHERRSKWVYLLGRIKPGVAWGPLQARMSGNLRSYLATLDEYKKADEQKNLAASHLVLTPGGVGIANMQQEYASGLHLLMAISALVLLIACANIANLLLVRGMARASETSLRMALGAQRRRILRQLLTESLVLSTLGGLAGLAVAYAGTRLLLSLAFPDSPSLPIHASPSFPVLAFSLALSMLTGLLFGIAPAWITSRAEPAEALRGANRTTRDGSSLLQRSLVVLQAALSLVLLVGAGLMSKSLGNLEHQDFGLQTKDRVVVHMDPEGAGYKTTQLQALYDEIQNRFSAMPGVERVGISLYSPLEGNNWGEGAFIEGRPEPHPGDEIGASWLRVSPGFFDLIGQRVLRGRGITAQDTATSPGVAVVNQAFVKKLFPNGEDPIGKRFGTSGVKSSTDMTIVGVVNNVVYNDPHDPLRAMYFRPLLQIAKTEPQQDIRSLYSNSFMLQLKGPVDGLESQVRHTLSSINPNLTVEDYSTFEHQIGGRFNQERLIARLTQMFGILALVLASIGLYGVTSYTVARRTSEIGVRMALGAGRGSVVGMVMRGAMLQAGLGLLLGLPAAILGAHFIKSQLYGIAGADLPVLAGALFVLTLSACLAGLIPARKAASIDPMQALRAE